MDQCPEDAVLIGTGEFSDGWWTAYECGPSVDDYAWSPSTTLTPVDSGCNEDQVIVGAGNFQFGRWDYYACGPSADDYIATVGTPTQIPNSAASQEASPDWSAAFGAVLIVFAVIWIVNTLLGE